MHNHSPRTSTSVCSLLSSSASTAADFPDTPFSHRNRAHTPSNPPARSTERHRKLHGKRLDHDERARKKAAREGHKQSENAQNLRGLRAKLYAKQRHAQKIQMRKTIKQHEERNVKGAPAEKEPSDPIPAYLLDRANPTTAKALSSQIKNKRAEKAARFSVPIPKVRGISEEELFKVYVLGLCCGEAGWEMELTEG